MNAFGKMGLLCCLAAVLLAGCGDGDRDVSAVSGAEVSIEQSGEISGSASEDISLGEISWDEVSKDYSAEKQIGESGIFIAVKKLSSSQKVYALEKGGKLITDFEFDTVSVIGSQYIVLAKNDNIAEIRDFSGNKICNTAYRIAAHEEKGGACVISRYVGEYSEKKKEFAVAKGGTRIQGDASGDILLDCEAVTDFEFDSYEISDDCEYIAMKKSGRIAALFRCDGTKADGTLYTVAKATDGGVYAVVKTDDGKKTYAVVRGGTLIGDTLLGGELLTGFDFDSCRLDASGCLVLENGGDIAEVRKADGTKVEGTFYGIAGEVKGGSIYVVKKRDGQKPVYAVVKGGKQISRMLLEGGEMLTGFDFDSYSITFSGYVFLEKDGELAEIRRGDGTKEERTAVKTTGSFGDELYSAVKGEGKDARYALVSGGETAGGGYIFDSGFVTGYDYVEITEYNGLARAKDSDGLYTLFGAGGRVKSICYKEARSYDLDGTDTVSMYALRADGKDEYTWYVRRIENGAATLEEYDEKAVCARDFDKLGGLLTKVAAAVKKDAMRPELDGLVSEEIIKEYYAVAADAAASSVGFETSLQMARDMHPYVWALYCLSKEDRGSGNEPYPDGMQGVVYSDDSESGVYRMSFSLFGGYAFMATKSDGKGGIIITEIVLML